MFTLSCNNNELSCTKSELPDHVGTNNVKIYKEDTPVLPSEF